MGWSRSLELRQQMDDSSHKLDTQGLQCLQGNPRTHQVDPMTTYLGRGRTRVPMIWKRSYTSGEECKWTSVREQRKSHWLCACVFKTCLLLLFYKRTYCVSLIFVRPDVMSFLNAINSQSPGKGIACGYLISMQNMFELNFLNAEFLP